jgi:hypothetical protein
MALQPVKPPETTDERFAALFELRDIVAQDEETGAMLHRSKKQWTLACDGRTKHKSRWNHSQCRSFTTEEAIEWGNKALEKMRKTPPGDV